MRRGLSVGLGLGLLVLSLVFVGCSDDEDCPVCPDEAPALTYAGSEACEGCHQATYDMFVESGHPYKLTEVASMLQGSGPTYPWDNEHTDGAIVSRDGPPAGTSWDDYAYVIGGYGWKARWVRTNGLIHTGADVQLNLWATGPEWVDYKNDGQDHAYNYSCFRCHTTGASPDGAWASQTTGTFAFGGVQCEECHGKGSQHVSDPDRFELVVDDTAEQCGRCHYRDEAHRVMVSVDSGTRLGFIRHHEQYDELLHSPHGALDCVACHDPHASVVYDNVASGSGVSQTCTESCHSNYDTGNHPNGPTCMDCHMPKASKSARSTNMYIGDVSSHTFMINPAAVGMTEMWTDDAAFMKQDEEGRGRITLDFACYGCHNDPQGVGGGGTDKDLATLSGMATGIHGAARGRLTASK